MKREQGCSFWQGQKRMTLAGLGVLLVLLTACAWGQSTVAPKPTPTQYTTLDLGLPPQALNAPVIKNVPDDQILHVGITFKLNQDELNKLGQSGVGKPGDTHGSDVAQKLGISEQDYQQLKDYFGVSDARLQLSGTRTSMTVDARAGSLAKLLQTRFVVHQLNDRTFYTPDAAHPPKVPSVVADKILSVTGLDSYSVPPQHHTLSSTQQPQRQSQMVCPFDINGLAVSPGSVAHAYGYDQFWHHGWHGEKMKINLVEIDGVDPNDLNPYFSCVGYKGKVSYANVDGAAPPPGGEATLDIEMIAGMAPAADIVDYQTNIPRNATDTDAWGQLNDALQQIIDDNAKHPDTGNVVSISLGSPEVDTTDAVRRAFRQRLNILTRAEHMTVFVASGDCAAFESDNMIYGTLGVSYPASDPLVVAVGGTQLAVDGQGNRADETVWSDGTDKTKCINQWGSGGGLSKYYIRPDWEKGRGVQNDFSTGRRQVPDVAAIAINIPIFFQGMWQPTGGTSAATPIWAAGMALTNQALLATKQVFYYGPDTFYMAASKAGKLKPYYDVLAGSNLHYKATPGWDYATGLGAPNLPQFYLVLQANI